MTLLLAPRHTSIGDALTGDARLVVGGNRTRTLAAAAAPLQAVDVGVTVSLGKAADGGDNSWSIQARCHLRNLSAAAY
jgi:hypothetical protein